METLQSYLHRKNDELRLLNNFLETPLRLRPLTSVNDVIEQKFHIAAALKAERALNDWACTETAWSLQGRDRVGPFRFFFDYQRANLEVHGPSFYQDSLVDGNETIYTSCGMAAISALLLASVRMLSEADVFALPGSYGETLELIDSHVSQLKLIRLKRSLSEIPSRTERPRILLLDSSITAATFEAALRSARPDFDLVAFDTTCFSSGSGRIRRVLNWARRSDIPIVLLRSHTKLDSLGLEYGRLGSAVFIARERRPAAVNNDQLAREMRNSVRLLGGAALPAHFPPYVGTKAYRVLTNQRVGTILKNCRRMARYFALALPHSSAELHFAHGLYVTLAPQRALDEGQTRQIAISMCNDLRKMGLPLRHAGSFGFDFGAVEWVRDTVGDRYVVRIAVPDAPTALWDDVAENVAAWWSAHEEQASSCSVRVY